MELADLARWTPVKVDFSGRAPAVYWADLSAERFVEPFFDQTVARWASGPRGPAARPDRAREHSSLWIPSRRSNRRA